ncbi:uncharacterized protein TRIADDRAFT_57285 [Trichoplax adhaerens]|uniref:CUE domain-containing protein n=1 Tax=Trichoplax adhaerens TaxID=10228 RepID=B3RZ09_TRIAD|nr:hypothetical protein TRIADDRAFT_57285 [Trichoplax adhaerens]EDV24119.1 hypothetical protein TRIADDRAFT_57285 [Trichoplax adhaerens]|eukprot:XP_002113645.1 hypothetical protein TRIADDRAFT_57285 [Trichoplax adhaerens]
MSTSHIPTSTLSSYPPGSEQSRSRNRPRLGFQEAMENFSTMFPTMDRSIIEAVLRSCNGHIQRTIDKLLVMTDSSPTDEILTGGDQPQIVSLSANTDTSSNSTNLPLGSTENNHPDMLLSIDQSFGNNNNNRDNNIYDNNLNLHNNNNAGRPTTYTSKYHPPLVGRLPDDFLRIKPTRSSHRQTPTYDPVALQMMEDERLAKWLQNEEFMRHLQSNEDFVRSLETEHNHHNRRSRRQGDRPQQQYQQLPQQHTIPPTEVIARNTEDAGAVGGRDEDESYNKKKLSTAEFREKLKTMGSS